MSQQPTPDVEAALAAAREDGASLALAIVIRTLTARSKDFRGRVGVELLDTALAIAKQGATVIALIKARKMPDEILRAAEGKAP